MEKPFKFDGWDFFLDNNNKWRWLRDTDAVGANINTPWRSFDFSTLSDCVNNAKQYGYKGIDSEEDRKITTSDSQQKIEIEAESMEEARRILKSKIPHGFSIYKENIVSNGSKKVVVGKAETIDEAYVIAQKKVPMGVNIIEKKELSLPKRDVTIIDAFDENTAKDLAKKECGKDAIIKTIKLSLHGKKGLLGIGRKPNQYEIEVFNKAVVEIIYRTKAKIIVEIGNTGKDEIQKIGTRLLGLIAKGVSDKQSIEYRSFSEAIEHNQPGELFGVNIMLMSIVLTGYDKSPTDYKNFETLIVSVEEIDNRLIKENPPKEAIFKLVAGLNNIVRPIVITEYLQHNAKEFLKGRN